MADLRAQLQDGLGSSYALERELGRGGMATVFLARDLKHDRPVALKVLHPELAASLGPDRFQREIRLAARLQHPHILTVLDSGAVPAGGRADGQAVGERLWFTMPYVEGESLRERLRRERQLPVEDALRVAREAAQALQYAHEHGIVHRDIKPENLLLTRDGNTLVADFGIARALGGSGDERLTETGLAVGTPAYMSPEQAAGDRGLDARTDIYSLAAVLYEILAGQPPYVGATTQALMVKRLTEPAPSVRATRPNVPEAVDGAIRKALSPVAADRFGSMTQFAGALQAPAVLDTMPTVPTPAGGVPPATVAAPAPAPKTRRRVPVAATTLLLGILIGLGVLFAWRRSGHGGGEGGTRVLAVLPFENLGDSADAYFADGVTDEVRTKLTQVAGLEVIARGSSNEYRHTGKRPTEIARELGADYLLTGTVRWDKAGGANRVRVAPELVEVRPGQSPRTRWGQQFEAGLTSVFQVQADIATRVVDALGVALADSVRQELAARPTTNLEAYDAFLKGEAITGTDPPAVRRQLVHYERAVALDSTFHQAWAQISRLYTVLYANATPTPELAGKARSAGLRARSLAPARPEGFLALGIYHLQVERDFQRAREALENGLRLAPSDVRIIGALAGLAQATGDWNDALARAERAVALDPRSRIAAARLSTLLFYMRRYPDAEAAMARELELSPTNITFHHQAAMLAVAQGDLARAERIARNVPPGVDTVEYWVQFARFEELGWLLSREQQTRLLALPPSAFEDRANWGLVQAQIRTWHGDRAGARAYADSARLGYQQNLAAVPDDAQQTALLGLSLAYAGRYDEAIRAAARAAELMPISTDAYLGPYIQLLQARVHMMAGDHDRAVALLEPLIRVPNNLSPAWLRVDPAFEPLRAHPGFRRLVEGTA